MKDCRLKERFKFHNVEIQIVNICLQVNELIGRLQLWASNALQYLIVNIVEVYTNVASLYLSLNVDRHTRHKIELQIFVWLNRPDLRLSLLVSSELRTFKILRVFLDLGLSHSDISIF
jgi:hypothetical protein